MAPVADGDLDAEISTLEARLTSLRLRRSQHHEPSGISTPRQECSIASRSHYPLTSAASHFLLLLSDSALPLGSFAFSSGLESYLNHPVMSSPSSSSSPKILKSPPFPPFLSLSLSSQGGSTLPFLLACYDNPSLLSLLDDAFDATQICPVARRASVAQGRALLAVWEKAFTFAFVPASISASSRNYASSNEKGTEKADAWREMLRTYTRMVKTSSFSSPSLSSPSTDKGTDMENTMDNLLPVEFHAHFPPLFGTICRILGLARRDAAYVFLLSHTKAVLSAAVRASALGPYRAQRILASPDLRDMVDKVIDREWETRWEDAGQYVPLLDLWTGRHELLYSRIFNS